MRRLALPALALLLLAATPADTVVLNGDVVIRGAQPGQVLGSTEVPVELRNRTCEVTFATANNASKHDTDVTVRTGADSFTLVDVESGDGVAIEETVPLVAGETLEVVLAATSGTTSLAFVVTAVCPEPDPTPLPEPDPEPAPDPDPTPDPEPQPDPDPTPDPEPEPVPGPEPTPDPGTGGPTLPETGGPVGLLAALGAALTVGGLTLTRRRDLH